MRRFEWGIIFLMVIYSVCVAVPPSVFWFIPGIPVFSDAVQGDQVPLAYEREIKRNSRIKYAVVIRQPGIAIPVCDATGGPFPYLTSIGPVVDHDLAWWTNNNPDCNNLSPGRYWVETTWTVVYPLGDLLPVWLDPFLGWIIPSKDVSRISPLFNITERT